MGKDHIICLLMATHLEAKPFILELPMTNIEKKPFPVYRKKNITLIISGIGKANAAMACVYSCLKFKPSCIANLGASGATNKKLALGEPLHVKTAFDYDRPQFKSKAPHKFKPDILEGFSYAKIATRDSAVLDPEERKKLAKTADLIDMECASVIQACEKFDTKCYIFKFVSDTPEHTSDNDIVENIRIYRSPFFTFFRDSVLPKL